MVTRRPLRPTCFWWPAQRSAPRLQRTTLVRRGLRHDAESTHARSRIFAHVHDAIQGFSLPAPEKIAELADRLRLLADPTRLTVAFALLAGESNPGCLVELAGGVAQPALSQHLSKMRLGRVVRTRRAGQKVFYELDPAVIDLVRYLLDGTRAAAGSPAATGSDADRGAAAGVEVPA
jgi:DNA-binding transcriptional ArsR family regulator